MREKRSAIWLKLKFKNKIPDFQRTSAAQRGQKVHSKHWCDGSKTIHSMKAVSIKRKKLEAGLRHIMVNDIAIANENSFIYLGAKQQWDGDEEADFVVYTPDFFVDDFTREEFESICNSVLGRILEPVKRLLTKAGISKDKI